MYLSKVSICNFRNIENLVVNLRAHLNVIVGANNIGKTNFIAAIQVALGQVLLAESDIPILKDGQRSEAPIQINLFFSSLTDEEQAQYIDILDFNPDKPEDSTASIHYEAFWPVASRRPNWSRWAGNRKRSEASVPEDVLQSIRVTLLTALRDATAELLPGRQSRLGRLLRLLASEKQRKEITEIIQSANVSLKSQSLVEETCNRIQNTLTGASGEKFAQNVQIGTAAPRFESIVNTLRLVLQGGTDESLFSAELVTNGLGYNNLIYIATVLSELAAADVSDRPLLVVEEPEAHLHPQLQCILSSFLSSTPQGGRHVQTVLTTHSPTIAAHVPPETIHVFHRDEKNLLVSTRIDECGLTERELRELGRLLDVTKATLLFANGVILVEGISEALLLPVLALRQKKPLEKHGISVVPVYGVDFTTLMKLFGEQKLRVRAAVVTDGDPGEQSDGARVVPATDSTGKFKKAARVSSLMERRNSFIDVFVSDVTLEYDLAAAGVNNAAVMTAAWESCYARRPRTLTSKKLSEIGEDRTERAREVWRGICLSDTVVSKPEFAQRLASELQPGDTASLPAGHTYAVVAFDIPDYLRKAIEFVIPEPVLPDAE